MKMYIRRSGKQESDTNSCLAQTKMSEETKSVSIDKLQLIQILQIIQEVRQSNELNLLAGTNNLQNDKQLTSMLIKIALIKVGYIPEKDNSVEEFYNKLTYYMSDDEIKGYLDNLADILIK
jgi:hypothetical protein